MKPKWRSLRSRWHRMIGSTSVPLDGIRLDVRPEIVGDAVRTQLLRGDYEYAERRLLLDLLRPGDRLVELGAGIGAVGLVAARRIGAEAVFSFEANPRLESVIRGNYALNDLHPTLQMRAVTLDGSPVSFFVTDVMLSSSLHARDSATEVTVDAVSIAEVLAAHEPTVLVLDIEGAETDLLPAADLSGVRALLVETHANVTGQPALDAMIAALKEKGLTISRQAHRNFVFERVAP